LWHQEDVLGYLEVVGAMPRGLIDLHHNLAACMIPESKFLRSRAA
jgi:hypothetical protein